MFFVDTHCHLNLDTFQDSIDQVVERAIESGVNRIVVPGIDVDTSRKAMELASKYDCIFAAVGTHPNEADKFEEYHIKIFEDLLKEPKVVAIGEIGFDFHHHPEQAVLQEKLLDMMLGLATQHDKPVILHSRNSLDALLTKVKHWINEQKPVNNRFFGVLHGFEGNFNQAMETRLLNLAIGIGGPITFKNAKEKQLLVKDLGLSANGTRNGFAAALSSPV